MSNCLLNQRFPASATCSTGVRRSRGGERSPRAEAASWPKPCSHREAAPAQGSSVPRQLSPGCPFCISQVPPRRDTDPKHPRMLQRARAWLIVPFSRGSNIQGRGSKSAADPTAQVTRLALCLPSPSTLTPPVFVPCLPREVSLHTHTLGRPRGRHGVLSAWRTAVLGPWGPRRGGSRFPRVSSGLRHPARCQAQQEEALHG